jgi:hypothetical protein
MKRATYSFVFAIRETHNQRVFLNILNQKVEKCDEKSASKRGLTLQYCKICVF